MQIYQFKTTPLIVNGPGGAKEAGAFAKGLGKKALIVTDSHLVEIGLLKDIKSSLDGAGVLSKFLIKSLQSPYWNTQKRD